MKDYKIICRQNAKKLLKEKNLKRIIYGFGENLTDWETEMLKFENDENFNNYCDEIKKNEDVLIYAAHA